jgi:hypothetical protein
MTTVGIYAIDERRAKVQGSDGDFDKQDSIQQARED